MILLGKFIKVKNKVGYDYNDFLWNLSWKGGKRGYYGVDV